MKKMSRRDLLKRAGIGVGGLAAGRALGGGVALAAGGDDRLRIAHVKIRSAADAALIGGFDDTHAIPAPDTIELLLWPGDVSRLRATGLDFEIVIDDLIAHDAAELARAPEPRLTGVPGERTAYRRLPDFEADLRQLVEDHPGRARLLELPTKSIEGRTIYGIEIATDVDRPGGRPVYYMDGIHHSREWPAAEMPIMFAFDLLEGYGEDERVTAIVDNVRTVIIPVMNPDGYNFSREALVDSSAVGNAVIGSAYWRKNRRGNPHMLDPVWPGFGVYGVDPNRNYPANWGDNAGGSSGSTSSETYRGAAPSSEPEVRAVRELMLTLPVTAGITHHTYGRLVLRAWGHTSEHAPDEVLMKTLGDAMAAYNNYTSQKSRQLYTTTGTHSDWMYAALGTIGYTFEHTTSFHPAYSNIPPMYVSNRPAFLLLAEAAMNPDYNAVIKGRIVAPNGQGVSGTLRIQREFDSPLWFNGSGQNPIGQGYFRESQDVAWETEDDGSFELMLPPSTRPAAPAGTVEAYPLTFSADGLAPRIVEVTVGRGEVEDLEDVVLSEVGTLVG